MAAKVLLGVVALTAIVGSPFAYNHFKSSSEETQKEGEAKNEQAVAEKPANASAEAKTGKPEVKAQNPEQNGDDQGPQTDPCDLKDAQTWDSTRGVLSDQSQCVRGEVLARRDQRQN